MNLPINRLRKIHIFEPKNSREALDSLEIRCHICGEKIVCAGDNWRAIKKVFIKRVLHHSWGHYKYEWNAKKKHENNFQLTFPYYKVATIWKTEDTLFYKSLGDKYIIGVAQNPRFKKLIELRKKYWLAIFRLGMSEMD